MKLLKHSCALALLATSALTSAHAAPITLTFEGVGDLASINDFYNGGTDSKGNSGTDHGVQFGTNTLGVLEQNPQANFSGEPTPNTIMFFLSGSAVLNYAPGFDTGFSFYFTTVAFSGKVDVYSGLNKTGSLLGSITLPALGNGPDPLNPFSNWKVGSLAFAGTAKSIDFSGTVNQVGYDNITFGSTNPSGTVPEPGAYAMLGLFLGMAPIIARVRRKQA